MGRQGPSMTGAPLSAAELSHLLKIYLAGINDTVIITDGELRDGTPGPMIKYINAAVTTVTSHRAEDLIGHPLATLYSHEIFSQVWEQLETIAENRRPMQHETQALDRHGHGVWLQINTLPIFDTNGRLLHFIRIGRDITARKRIEQERETTQRLLATVFGVIDQALGVVDHAGNFSLVNTAMTRRLGWSVLGLIGKPFPNVIDESSRKWLNRNLAAREELEQTCRLETGLLHRDGTIIPGEIVSTIIMMEQEERQYRVITFQPKAAAAAAAAASQTSLQGPIQAA